MSKKKAGLAFGRRSSSKDVATPQPSGRLSNPEITDTLSNAVVVSTTRQLDAERGRTAMLEEELHKLRAQTHTKLDERLNEMARRLNKTNQVNEERYKAGMMEIEGIKQQVVAAKKTYQRKAEDLYVENCATCFMLCFLFVVVGLLLLFQTINPRYRAPPPGSWCIKNVCSTWTSVWRRYWQGSDNWRLMQTRVGWQLPRQ